jgi:hypothetical protein
VGIGALAIPGVGPFIAAGAFGAALTGAGIGAGVGAIAGALVGMGIPKEEAEYYEGEVRRGRTLVTVKADGRYAEAREVLTRHGAYDIENRHAATTTGTGAAGEAGPSTHPAGLMTPPTSDEVETGTPTWSEGIVPPRGVERWEDAIPHGSESEYEVVGGDDYPPHEHRFVGERCEVCGATRRYRRAA